MKHLKKALALLLAAVMVMSCIVVADAKEPDELSTLVLADADYNWVSTWGTAEEKCDINADRMPQLPLNGTTVRQIIRVTTSGEVMKLKFSNQYGRSDVVIRSLHIAKQVQADKSTIDTATDTVVTVDGKEEFTIKAGQTIETDPVAFSVKALENVAVSMYFGDAPTSNVTGHRGARATTYQISGNQVSTATFSTSDQKTTTSWFFLCDVALDMPAGSRAVVCFGDSITDGYGTDADYLGKRPDSYTRWGDYFAKRLQADEKTKNVAVINEGIGSNSILSAYPTDSGRDRYARDLLAHDGVEYVIIHFGVNDLQKLSNTNKYSQLIAEYEKMIKLAHDNDILVYAAPILPFGTSSDYYSAASEQVRTMINDWFRSPESNVDGIIDFEGAVADPNNPVNILEKYTHSDGLHPYDGYDVMANAIDLSLFYEVEPHEHVYETVVTKPTCLEGGFTTDTCTVCGRTRVYDRTEALGHDWDDGKVTTAPTETTAGVLTITCTRCGETKTKRIPRIGSTVPDNIDFTNLADADKFEIWNPGTSKQTEGVGVNLITTRDAFEPCNGQNSGAQATNPKDVVVVPVEGDWVATLKFDFSQGSARNGYYQFFGFYAAESDDYQNLAGIRGGNNDLQNFLRVNGSITAETDGVKSTPGLGSAGTYWFRIVKEADTYTCFRTSDGETFTEMFSYADTGIEADKLVIDAYTGMTEGYTYTLKSLEFEDVGGPTPCVHDYKAVTTAPTCTEAGFTVYTCTKCGDSYIADEVDALGHSYRATVTAPTCTEAGYTTYICAECDDSYVGDEVPALGHDYKAVMTVPTCTEAGYTTYTCAKCGDSYVADEAAALGHDYKAVVLEPTCTEEGYTTYTCARCNDEYVDDRVEALGHDFKNGKCTRCDTVDPDYKCDGGEACPSKNFTDAPKPDNWAHEGIDYCVENGLMNGTSETIFSPSGTLTRAQLVTILYRVAGEPEVEFKGVFKDVAVGQWYSDAIEWAAANDIVNGVGDGKFNPNGKITREQIATILYRYAGSPKVEGSLKDFPDENKVSSYAVDALVWATKKGLINGIESGDTTTLSPASSTTRAQIAAIIMRYLEKD